MSSPDQARRNRLRALGRSRRTGMSTSGACRVRSGDSGSIHWRNPSARYSTLTRAALVHVSKLPSGLVFDEARRTLAARRSGLRFGLGDRLRVRLVEVDRIAARLSFDLEADPSDGRKRRRARAAGGP